MKIPFPLLRLKTWIMAILALSIVGIEAALLGSSIYVSCQFINGHIGIYSALAIVILLLWMALMVIYLVWLIHFYNVNQGMSEERRAEISLRNQNSLLAAQEMASPTAETVPIANPYASETLGIPPGTIRGTLALTLLVMALSLMIYSMGMEGTLDAGSVWLKHFEYFETAFIMMIAFYFGSKSLETLRGKPQTPPATQTTPVAKSAIPTEASDETEEESLTTPAQLKQWLEAQDDTPEAPMQSVSIQTSSSQRMKASLPEQLAFQMTPTAISSVENASLEITKYITEAQIEAVAAQHQLDKATVQAVMAVESSGRGFLQNGDPKILFEGHIFWQKLEEKGIDPRRYVGKLDHIVYPKWTKKYYKGGIKEYERLEAAKLVDEEAALLATSWGLFQIMGFNHTIVGYDSVTAFVQSQYESEQNQLESFVKFCEQRNLLKYLQKQQWASFAERYNGPLYKQNLYDLKLQNAYEKYRILG